MTTPTVVFQYHGSVYTVRFKYDRDLVDLIKTVIE
jgi:hypothetical protein